MAQYTSTPAQDMKELLQAIIREAAFIDTQNNPFDDNYTEVNLRIIVDTDKVRDIISNQAAKKGGTITVDAPAPEKEGDNES